MLLKLHWERDEHALLSSISADAERWYIHFEHGSWVLYHHVPEIADPRDQGTHRIYQHGDLYALLVCADEHYNWRIAGGNYYERT